MTVPLSPRRAGHLLAAMNGRRVAVVGDVFLDRYLVGQAERLSREGPVPVLAYRRSLALPGGAANPARNIVALGARAVQIGLVGADGEAEELRQALATAGIDAAGLIVDPARPTTVKTRIVAEGLSVPQQVARIDRQARVPAAGPTEAALVAAVRRLAGDADAVLVSHYRSGVVTAAVCDAVRAAAAATAICLSADAQGDLDRFAAFHVVRVGRQDATASLGAWPTDAAAQAGVLERCRQSLHARVLLVGRGAEGTSVCDGDGHRLIRPTNVSEVFDVAGAGDTVIALTTLALVAGATVDEAVGLATVAAGIVVRRLGVSAATGDEIVAELARWREA